MRRVVERGGQGQRIPRETLFEAVARLAREPRRMLVQPALQRGIRGRGEIDRGGCEALHLEPHPPPHNQVVAIQPEPQRLAVIDLVAHRIGDQRVQFGLRRAAAKGLGELAGQSLDPRRVDHDPPVLRRAVVAEYRKDQRPENQEMNQRLAQHPRRHLP